MADDEGVMLRFATFLAPSIRPTYSAIADYVGKALGCDVELTEGRSFTQFEQNETDVGFICGLPYVLLARRRPAPVELLAAPVLQGDRYGERPIYYSDVIVRRDSAFRSFADLRGASWSYNDCDSQSGYGITRYWLVRMGETKGYFGHVVEAGFHQESIRLVRSGEIDASAIDSQVLAVAMRDDPALAEEVRIIDSLGPSTIQPIVASRHLSDTLKSDIHAALLSMHCDPEAKSGLMQGMIERLGPVKDADYEDIREMLAASERAGFLKII